MARPTTTNRMNQTTKPAMIDRATRAVGAVRSATEISEPWVLTTSGRPRPDMAVGDDGEKQSVIRTVHGRGFRFIPEVTTSSPAQAASGPAIS